MIAMLEYFQHIASVFWINRIFKINRDFLRPVREEIWVDKQIIPPSTVPSGTAYVGIFDLRDKLHPWNPTCGDRNTNRYTYQHLEWKPYHQL